VTSSEMSARGRDRFAQDPPDRPRSREHARVTPPCDARRPQTNERTQCARETSPPGAEAGGRRSEWGSDSRRRVIEGDVSPATIQSSHARGRLPDSPHRAADRRPDPPSRTSSPERSTSAAASPTVTRSFRPTLRRPGTDQHVALHRRSHQRRKVCETSRALIWIKASEISQLDKVA